jgi:hypothetical protein
MKDDDKVVINGKWLKIYYKWLINNEYYKWSIYIMLIYLYEKIIK